MCCFFKLLKLYWQCFLNFVPNFHSNASSILLILPSKCDILYTLTLRLQPTIYLVWITITKTQNDQTKNYKWFKSTFSNISQYINLFSKKSNSICTQSTILRFCNTIFILFPAATLICIYMYWKEIVVQFDYI